MVKNLFTSGLCILAACLLMSSSSLVFAQGGPPVFQNRNIPMPTATPVQRPPPSEPTPRGWIIAGVAAVLLAGSVLFYFASRAWRSANIFERKYRFPRAENAALRFGGNRSGGLMAAIEPTKNKRNA